MTKRDAAYALVDLSKLSSENRARVVEDAQMGGNAYGVVVVEEFVNGPASRPLYGFYYDNDHPKCKGQEAKWRKALAAFGVSDDADGEADESDLRKSVEQETSEAADAIRRKEDEEIAAVTKEEPKETPAPVNKARR